MDVSTATFEQEVTEASKLLPVVVDFWAPWCGPCRTLAPVIEKVIAEHEGRIKLVKINSDENVELATACGVRSIPNVVAFKNGKPVAQFMGAVPESQVRAFVGKLLPSPSEQALERAKLLFTQHLFDEAERELDAVKPEQDWRGRFESLKQGIAYARAGRDGPGEEQLRATLTADPNDHDARLALVGLYASKCRYPQAMDELLEIVRRGKSWRDGEARKQLLGIFALAADQPEVVAEYRRKLAQALH